LSIPISGPFSQLAASGLITHTNVAVLDGLSVVEKSSNFRI
jgi:hypothetical protein